MQDIEQRIMALEERLAFQEHALQKLDDALADQQQQLLTTERRLQLLLDQLQKLESSLPVSEADEKPPHY